MGLKKKLRMKYLINFKRGEFSYLCTLYKLTNDGQLKVFQNQKEILSEKANAFIIPNELKTYIGKQNKVTLDIKNY